MSDATPATRDRRLAGSLIDSFLLLSIILPAMWATGLLQLISEKKEISAAQTIIFTLFGWSVFVMLNGQLLSKYGQTIGKRLVRTKIVTMDGNLPPLYNSIVLRYFMLGAIGYIPFIGLAIQLADCLFIFRADRRCFHDHLAGTMVVNAGEESGMP